MTIDEVMELVYKRLKARMYEWDVSEVLEADQAIKNAILALLDAEAEVCAGVVEASVTFSGLTDAVCLDRASACRAIRARIAARKGGAKP